MRKKNLNQVFIEGWVFDHDLSEKTVKNEKSPNFGKPFINGKLSIAVDEAGMNVVDVYYTYVTPTSKAGTPNRTYNTLKSIIDNPEKVWINGGRENAMLVKISSSIALNDFVSNNNEIVSAKRVEGGFIDIIHERSEKPRDWNRFIEDMVIISVNRVEPDEEKHITQEYATVKGYIFNFRNEILPVEFRLDDMNKGIAAFEALEASQATPAFIKVWGEIENLVEETEKVTESSFGDPLIETFKTTRRTWRLRGIADVPYDFGDEEVMTKDDIKAMKQARELKLSEIRQRNDEWKSQRAAATPTPAAVPAIPSSGNNFIF